MSSLTSMSCCGIQEIDGITEENSKDSIKTTCKAIFEEDEKCAFLIFTDINKKKHGKKLHKYIINNNLGQITKSPSKINPNSKHSLAIWLWTLNKPNLKQWWQQNKSKNEQ